MLADPDVMEAVRKEASGRESKGTWDMASVSEAEAEASKVEVKKTGQKVHSGSLMSISEFSKHVYI